MMSSAEKEGAVFVAGSFGSDEPQIPAKEWSLEQFVSRMGGVICNLHHYLRLVEVHSY